MVNFNGEIVEGKRIISSQNRAFKYGDGVFDTLKCVSGKIHFWEDHYLRLMASMRVLRMEIPISFTMEFLEKQILNLLDALQMTDGAYRVRISVFRTEGGYYTPLSQKVDYLIEATPLNHLFYGNFDTDYNVDLFKDYYVSTDFLSTIKTIARPVQILAGVYAQENDYNNCLLINQHKNVVSALNGNIFLVFGNTIKTPDLQQGCLNGIIRKNIIKIVEKTPDLVIEQAAVSPFELQKADELFITNSIIGIQPVSQYRKKTYNKTTAQTLLGKLNFMAATL